MNFLSSTRFFIGNTPVEKSFSSEKIKTKHNLTIMENNNYQNKRGTAFTRWMLTMSCVALCLFTIQTNAQVVAVTNPTNTTPNLAATYTTLAAAITAVNSVTAISGPVTITLNAANPQTAPVGGYSITAAITGGSVANTITFAGSGNTITAGVGTSTTLDAFFKITGTDFITISNFVMSESAGNTTATTQIELGVALFYATATT